MLEIEVITLFPRMIEAPLGESILGKAQERGLLKVHARDLRPYGVGKHRLTDDQPYGGGAGMVMKPEPLVQAIEEAKAALDGPGNFDGSEEFDGARKKPAKVILLDPQGSPFNQACAQRLAQEDGLIFVCGRYEGVDERVRPWIDEAISLGDFILTGGESAAVCVIDAVARLRPGVLGNEDSGVKESFEEGLLEGPQYTRPAVFRGMSVPEVLVSGAHFRVDGWRRLQAMLRTRKLRPDLWAKFQPSPKDQKLLDAVESKGEGEER